MQTTTLVQLQALIDEAYHLFKAYPMGGLMAVCNGCGCCLQASDAKLLQSTAIKKVDRRLIYEYLDAAVADEDLLIRQMKHLLPRVLELLVQGEYLRHSTEIILDKCHCDRAEYWPTKEIDFLQRFAVVYLQWVYESNDQANTLDEVVLMFHLAGLDIAPLLACWESMLGNPKALQDLLNVIVYDFQRGRYDRPFSNYESSLKISNWLNGRDLRHKVIELIVDEQQQPSLCSEKHWMYDVAFDRMFEEV